MATKTSNPIKHLAVMRLSAMGDVAMTVPVLSALLQQYPNLKITVISRPFFKPFFAHLPNVHFFEFDDKYRHKGFIGLLRLFFDLKKLKIDAFADLHNVLRSKIVSSLFIFSGVKRATVDKGRKGKKALTRATNKIFIQLPSMFERHLSVFRKLGFIFSLDQPVFPNKPVIDDKFQEVLGSNYKYLIGIAPFAQYSTKVYPLDLMQKVVNELATEPSYKILLFGGGATEKQKLDTLSGSHDNVINVAGLLTFKDELNLIANLDVMVSMDSGNGHLAAMYGVKVISIWGATHPYAGFMPYNQSLEQSVTADRSQYPLLPTSVYGNKTVEGYEDVMRSITPQTIISVIKKYL